MEIIYCSETWSKNMQVHYNDLKWKDNDVNWIELAQKNLLLNEKWRAEKIINQLKK